MSSKLNHTVASFWVEAQPIVTRTVDISFNEALMCEWNVLIGTVDDACSGVVIGDLYADVSWLAIEFAVDETLTTLANGTVELDRKTARRISGFKLIVDEYHKNILYELVLQNSKIKIQQSDTGSPVLEAMLPTISTEAMDGDFQGLFELTIKFEIADLPMIGAVNCEVCDVDIFEGGPVEDGCPPVDPAECEDMDISLVISGDIVTATVTGAPGSSTIRIEFRAPGGSWVVESEDASMINAAAFGEYRFTAISGFCRAVDSYVNTNPCNGFDVKLGLSGDTITATVENGGGGISYTWTLDDVGLPDVGNSITALVSGVYKVVVANADGCEDSATINVDLDACNWTVTITQVDGLLTAVLTDVPGGAGTPTFEWFLDDDGTGFDAIAGTTATIPVGGTGVYKVIVTIDACEKADWQYVPAGAVPEAILHVTVIQVEGYLVATVVEAGPFTYQWFKQAGSGYTFTEIIGETDAWLVPAQDGVYICLVKKTGSAGSDGHLFDDSLVLGYHHIQGAASAVWTITHPAFGFVMDWWFFDTSGNPIYGTITRPDLVTTIVTFSAVVDGEGFGGLPPS